MPVLQISVAATGDQPLLAAPGPRQFIRILGGEISSVTAQATSSLKSGASTTIWKSAGLNTVNSNVVLNVDRERTLDCNPGEALNMNNSGAGQVTGTLEYVIYGAP
jgi:hypothetical protein